MKRWVNAKRKQSRVVGFTIVELLIVVVVIAILAAITIVAYNGIRERATISQVQSALTQANKKVLAYAVENADQYPANLAAVGITNSAVAYQYTVNNGVSPATYAITASNGIVGSTIYYMSNTQTTPKAGTAPGHNIMPWDEASSNDPLMNSTGVSVVTSEYYSAPKSIQIAPTYTSKNIRIPIVSASVGQTITVSAWLKTASDWNGTSANSKIRFGNSADNALAQACSYNGIKTTWTFVACSYTATATYNSFFITFGNDGTIGNIWLDDVSISIQ